MRYLAEAGQPEVLGAASEFDDRCHATSGRITAIPPSASRNPFVWYAKSCRRSTRATPDDYQADPWFYERAPYFENFPFDVWNDEVGWEEVGKKVEEVTNLPSSIFHSVLKYAAFALAGVLIFNSVANRVTRK